jgi:hypothetical protein
MKAIDAMTRLGKAELRRSESYRLIDVIMMAGITMLFVTQVMAAQAAFV